MLLVDYLEDAAEFLKEKRKHLEKLTKLHRKTYDREIKKEIIEIKKELAKKRSEIHDNLLLNLEEFRALNKYYPDLVKTFMEDKYIGKILSKKEWLLHFKPLPPQEAAIRFHQLRMLRAQLREAARFVKNMRGIKLDGRALSSTFPVLRGRLKNNIDKDDVLETIKEIDRELIKEGWLVLLNDSLIYIPIGKFMTNVNNYRIQELQAKRELLNMRGRGTIAETAVLRKFQKLKRKREHYEKMIKQILLSNPDYLRSLKKKNWLSRKRQGNLDKIVQSLTPHTIKERVWLNKMSKKVNI